MTATINECLAQLESNLTAALVSTYANKVYGYRTLDDKLDKMVSLSHLSTIPANSATGGFGREYEIGAILSVKHDGSAAQLEAAEQSINSLENAIYDALIESKNSYWAGIDFRRPSAKPPSPAGFPGVRYGEVFFVLILR